MYKINKSVDVVILLWFENSFSFIMCRIGLYEPYATA